MDPDQRRKSKIKLKDKFKNINSEGLITNIVNVGLNGVFVSLIIAIFHFIMSRKLGPEQYGELSTLLTISSLILMTLSAICFIIARFITYYKTRQQYEKMKYLANWAFIFFFFIGLIAFIVTYTFSKNIANFLAIPDNSIIKIFGFVIWISFMTPIIEGILRGLQKYSFMTKYKLSEWFLRVLIASILIFLGFKIKSIIISLILGSMIVIVFAGYKLKHIYINKPYKTSLKEVYKFAFPVFLACLFFAILANVDLILVKHFFSATAAGYYAAASLLAKLSLGMAFGSAGVMFPKIVEHFSNGENKKMNELLKNTLKITLIVGAAITIITAIFPHQIAYLLFGNQYNINGILSIYVFAMFFLSISAILMMYELAVKRYEFIFIFLMAALFEIYQISMHHVDLYQIVWTLFFVNLFVTLFMLFQNRKAIFESVW